MQYALWMIRSGLRRLVREEDGQDLVEYGLILLLCVIASVASVGSVATVIANYFTYIISHYPSV